MSKRELIDAIIKHNTTASPEFLSRFGERDLKAYLDRVCMIHPEQNIHLRRSATEAKLALVA